MKALYAISIVFYSINIENERKIWVGNSIFHLSLKIGKYYLKSPCLHFSVQIVLQQTGAVLTIRNQEEMLKFSLCIVW